MSGKIEKVLFAIHGYAQLASDFIKDFDFLKNENVLIITPEGLSRFYSKFKPAASWMTKIDRENEINDYVNYLDLLYDNINSDFIISRAEKIILGFSQGVHTAVRWFIQSRNEFDKLILCSSDFPSDADYLCLKKKLNNSKMYYIYGTDDPVLNGSKQFLDSIARLRSNGINYSELTFDGSHEINVEYAIKAIIE